RRHAPARLLLARLRAWRSLSNDDRQLRTAPNLAHRLASFRKCWHRLAGLARFHGRPRWLPWARDRGQVCALAAPVDQRDRYAYAARLRESSRSAEPPS